MFVIKNKQIEAFKNEALQSFVGEMVNHVKTFFPNHYTAMQEYNTRATIHYAFIRAKRYGLTTQRNVCLYLNNMLVLGSNFDKDPQYPWAAEILNDKKEKDARVRIDKLSDKMIEEFGQIRGPRYVDINRALLNLNNQAAGIYQKMMGLQFKEVIPFLNWLYPKKYEVVGENNLNRLAGLGKVKAAAYGITSEPNVVLFIVFMFLSGAGFDKDPQFPWATEILNDPKITDQNIKAKSLFDKAISNLKSFLNQYPLK